MGYDVFLLVTKDFVAQMLALVDGKGYIDIVIFYRDYFRTKNTLRTSLRFRGLANLLWLKPEKEFI